MTNRFTVLTVSQLNLYVRSLLESDKNLSHLFVRAEISNFNNHYRSGHLYMTLKDDTALIKAVMFKASAQMLRFMPQDGMRVIVSGRVSIYERDGQYQFYIDDMQPDGVGALYIGYEQLKAKLEAEGLFDEAIKRPLPQYPQRIALITSPTGAALQDMLNIFARRWPVAEIKVYPVLVQGVEAPAQICKAVGMLSSTEADVAIVGRGGGSIEELWAFNDENVARAIVASPVPVISAVGHETDYTIADFAADLRAPTPSAAAELATPDIESVKHYIGSLRYSLFSDTRQIVNQLQRELQRIKQSPAVRRPETNIQSQQERVDKLLDRVQRAAKEKLMQNNMSFQTAASKLDALSPLKVLARGYSISFNEENKVIQSIEQIKPNDSVRIRYRDGNAVCSVNSIYPEELTSRQSATEGKEEV